MERSYCLGYGTLFILFVCTFSLEFQITSAYVTSLHGFKQKSLIFIESNKIHFSRGKSCSSRKKSHVNLTFKDLPSYTLIRSREFWQPNIKLHSFLDDENIGGEDEFQVIEGNEMSDELFDQLAETEPSKFSIMTQLLGINLFTYILAALIVISLSLNAFLGPGWLGQKIGLEGTGTITQISDSLPTSIDLSAPEYLF